MKRWKIVVLVIVVVLALSGVGVARFLMPYQLEEEIKLARAHGIATTYAECFKPIPPDQDAAPDYDRAQKLSDGFWTPSTDKARESLAVPGGPTPAGMAVLRAAFNKDNDYLAAIHAAAAKPGCAYRATSGDLPFITSPRFANQREAAKALRDEAILRMYEGKPDEAARTLHLGLNVAKHAYSHPTLIGSLVGAAIDAIVDSGYKQLLMNAGPNADVDRAVREALAPNLTPPDISHALSSEVAETFSFVTATQSDSGNAPFYTVFSKVFNKGQHAAGIHYKIREIVASRVPPERQRQAIQGVLDEYESEARHNPILKSWEAHSGIALKVMDRLDTAAAQRRTLYAAACVLEYRARTGAYPVSLSQAVKPVPLDPFTGEPLAYKQTAKGFELVSVEASRRRSADSPAKRRNDMVFAYPAP